MSLGKYVVRGTVIGGLALGGLVALAGPDRFGALFSQARTAVNDQIDKSITDPVALRAQLRTLQEQYPKRIADVRGDLAQLRAQMAQLNRDAAVSQRVVQMADADLEKLSAAIDHASAATVQQASFEPGVPAEVVIVLNGDRLPLSAAQTRTHEIASTRNAYSARIADIERDRGYMLQQERQLTQLLTKLENEQTAFSAQMFDLDRQIDAIGRNDRMIAIISDRQQSLDEQSRYRAASLDHITTKLADIRARQEATLSSIAKMQATTSYEDAAKTALDRENGLDAARRAANPEPVAKRTVIEINPDALPARPKAVPTSTTPPATPPAPAPSVQTSSR